MNNILEAFEEGNTLSSYHAEFIPNYVSYKL